MITIEEMESSLSNCFRNNSFNKKEIAFIVEALEIVGAEDIESSILLIKNGEKILPMKIGYSEQIEIASNIYKIVKEEYSWTV